MLKLPKGLKKKKKGKKSKKDQELFTEEELEQYRREHQHQPAAGGSTVPSDSEEHLGGGEKSENDEEWSKFAALTSGIDSILKKTQGDLDRIKSTSFFQKVPTQIEQETLERKERQRREQEQLEWATEETKNEHPEEQQAAAENLISAVIELDESEPNSEAGEDDIFDTGYIDAIASGELPIAYVPESPVLESYEGEVDPFDTSYAEKIIKGPEVSKRGKKLVSIGSAVEVLTGRVETSSTGAARGSRQRRGLQNLLLESFDEGEQNQHGHDKISLANRGIVVSLPRETNLPAEVEVQATFSLLDDYDELPSNDVPVDLSVSLHLSLQKQYQEDESPKVKEQGTQNRNTELDLDEFEYRETSNIGGSHLGQLIDETDAVIPQTSALNQLVYDLSAFDEPEVGDPFDTGFVEKILPATAVEDDEFDPRAEEPVKSREVEKVVKPVQVLPAQIDLLSDHTVHRLFVESETTSEFTKDLLSSQTPEQAEPPQLTPFTEDTFSSVEQAILVADPFDTSNVECIVVPGKTELKYLEEELLKNDQQTGGLNHSLSDPDFDPRADCDSHAQGSCTSASHQELEDFHSIAQRKSSLSLHIGIALGASTNRSKSVVFAVPTPDLLRIDTDNLVTKKPLTPYYNPEIAPVDADIDPFDTSFVSSIAPTQLELHLLDQEFNNVTRSISDPEFDPRADTVSETVDLVRHCPRSDLLGVSEEKQDQNKVLTPACLESTASPELYTSDPFDTSIAVNLKPGRAELKLLEDELIPPSYNLNTVSDILSDGAPEASSVFVKVLTPQISSTSFDQFSEQEEVDPFDTSFVPNLGPGRAEIKLLESELID